MAESKSDNWTFARSKNFLSQSHKVERKCSLRAEYSAIYTLQSSFNGIDEKKHAYRHNHHD